MPQQKKSIAVIIGVILLFLIGILAFTQMNKQPAGTNPQPATQVEGPNAAPASNLGTIQNLLKPGVNTTCDISYPDGSTNGTVYVSGTKVRGDFNVKVNDREIVSHMIQTDGVGYFWSDDNTQGTKIKIDPNATPSGQTQTTDLNQEVEMDCSPWSLDGSKFIPPTNIQFTDLSQAVKSQPSGNTKIDPSICNQITDPQAKASCLKSLDGN